MKKTPEMTHPLVQARVKDRHRELILRFKTGSNRIRTTYSVFAKYVVVPILRNISGVMYNYRVLFVC